MTIITGYSILQRRRFKITSLYRYADAAPHNTRYIFIKNIYYYQALCAGHKLKYFKH